MGIQFTAECRMMSVMSYSDQDLGLFHCVTQKVKDEANHSYVLSSHFGLSFLYRLAGVSPRNRMLKNVPHPGGTLRGANAPPHQEECGLDAL